MIGVQPGGCASVAFAGGEKGDFHQISDRASDHERYSNGTVVVATAIVVKDYGLLVRFSSTVSGQSYLQLTDPPTE